MEKFKNIFGGASQEEQSDETGIVDDVTATKYSHYSENALQLSKNSIK
jgi:hypothetical protein